MVRKVSKKVVGAVERKSHVPGPEVTESGRTVLIDVLYETARSRNVLGDGAMCRITEKDGLTIAEYAGQQWRVEINEDEINKRLGIFGRVRVPRELIEKVKGWSK